MNAAAPNSTGACFLAAALSLLAGCQEPDVSNRDAFASAGAPSTASGGAADGSGASSGGGGSGGTMSGSGGATGDSGSGGSTTGSGGASSGSGGTSSIQLPQTIGGWQRPLVSCPRAGRTIYVASDGSDDAAGGLTTPVATLAKASTLARPGDTIQVRGGTYRWPSQWIAAKGTATSRICFEPYPDEHVVLDGSSHDYHHIVVGGSYLDFLNFEITAARENCVLAWQAKDVRFLSNIIHSCRGMALMMGSVYDFDKTVNLRAEGNLVYNNGLSNPRVGGEAETWPAIVNGFGASNIVIANNYIAENYGEGIDFILVRGGLAYGNVVVDNFSVNIYLDNASDVVVDSNFVFNTGNTKFYRDGMPADGVRIAQEDVYDGPQNRSQNNTIINNIIVNTGSGFFYNNYMVTPGLIDTLVANNTFVGAAHALLYIDRHRGTTGSVFENNVFLQNGAGRAGEIPSTAGLTFRNNAWFGKLDGRVVGSGDVLEDPKLLQPGEPEPQAYRPAAGSPLIDRGVVSAAVVADFLGTARPQGTTHDIGAFEVKP